MKHLHRRSLLRAGTALPWLLATQAKAASVPPLQASPGATPFNGDSVRQAAEDLAARPYQAPQTSLPNYLSNLSYDQYRNIRFDPARAMWRGMHLPYQLEFFHRGFLYTGRVDIFEVVAGRAAPVRYTPDVFDFGNMQRPTNEDLGYAGFRVHTPLNRPDYYDELFTFLGASYFRAVARGLGYGLSARGLAIRTADPGGEEFPVFKTFWIERPALRATSIVVHALLDSPSATAAFRFDVTPGSAPGAPTVFDTQMVLYPRVDIDQAGIATMTSMFLFDSNDRRRVDDWRPAVHDSDGLMMATGHGEVLWRALANPGRLQVSSFLDRNPRGFGLMQRKRDFAQYQDLESHYEKRPCLWVEPVGDWGEGAVMLVEIPSELEVNDNMVAFWRPKEKLQAKVPYSFHYRLHWGTATPIKTLPAPVTATMVGAEGPGAAAGTRTFVVDFAGLKSNLQPRLDLAHDKGTLAHPLAQPDPEGGGWRISFTMTPGSEPTIELRGRLMQGDQPLTETWTYRWTS